jgi:hypothetical protein
MGGRGGWGAGGARRAARAVPEVRAAGVASQDQRAAGGRVQLHAAYLPFLGGSRLNN